MATISLPTTTSNSQSGSKHRWLGWLKRGVLGLAAFLLVLGALGPVYQVIGNGFDQIKFPPPGQLYDVGGYKMHLYCTGPENTGAPTVILETIAGGASPYWAWVQPEIAKSTRVCSYDRAGRAWSQAPTKPLSLEQTAMDLHTLLEHGGVKPPYVMVGHSLGGIYVRQFAADYPAEVVGMALIDASNPDQLVRSPGFSAENDAGISQFRVIALLARFGVARLFFALGGEFDFADLPAAQHAQVVWLWSSPQYFESKVAESLAAPQIFADGRALGRLGNLPLAVVSRGTGADTSWIELQSALATLSTNTMHITIPGSTHVSLAFNPKDAHATSSAILKVVQAARTGQPLKAE